MNAMTLRRLNDLRLAMEEDPRMVALRQAEKAMMEDEAVAALYREKENARADYLNLRLSEGEDAPATVQAKKTMLEKETALNAVPSAKRYSECFTAVRFLIQEVDDILFASFKTPVSCGGHHAAD